MYAHTYSLPSLTVLDNHPLARRGDISQCESRVRPTSPRHPVGENLGQKWLE